MKNFIAAVKKFFADHPKVKTVLVIFVKQAINALIINAALWKEFPKEFNGSQIKNFLEAFGTVILARELTVWAPVASRKLMELLNWTNTNSDPNSI